MNREIPVLQMFEISKSFGGIQALKHVNFDLCRGEIHALVGKNGAGKSTLMKILLGAVQADSGRIVLEGEEVRFSNPLEAQRNGVAMVWQELANFPNLTVAENILINKFEGLVNWRQTFSLTNSLLRRVGLTINPRERLSALSVAQQQLVEIARVLAFSPRIVVFDEPTSALSAREREQFYKTVSQLKMEGLGIVYVTHRLEEVFRLADRVTVLRDGEKVFTLNRDDVDEETLVNAITGKVLTKSPRNAIQRSAAAERKVLLEVRGLSLSPYFQDVSFKLFEGEILGIVGVLGSGKTELGKALTGALSGWEGEIYVDGRQVTPRSPRDALRLGLGYLPEDRKAEGLVLSMSAAANISLSSLERITHGVFLSARRERLLADSVACLVGVSPPNLRMPAFYFSGGNQQKILLCRLLARNLKVLVLDEPTRGIDIGAKRSIYDSLREIANSGKGILVLSSEFEEVHSEVDRLLVLNRGRIVGDVNPKEVSSEHVIALAMAKR